MARKSKVEFPAKAKRSCNPLSGAIEIVCSEPAGFPLKFHWTTTVALDGTVTSTPMTIEPPQPAQPQPANA